MGRGGASTLAVPSDGPSVPLRPLPHCESAQLISFSGNTLETQTPDSQLLLDRTDHSDLSGSSRVLL